MDFTLRLMEVHIYLSPEYATHIALICHLGANI